MKNVIMHKWNSVRNETWGWSINEVYDDWNNTYSTPYYVEIPDTLVLGKSVAGEEMYFSNDGGCGYQVSESSNKENCTPCLVGGDLPEIIKLVVIAPVQK